MKLQVLSALAGPILRSLGQRDLADKLTDAIDDIAGELIAVKARQDRLEEKYQQLGRDVGRMLAARSIKGEAPSDFERRLAAAEAQIKEWLQEDNEGEDQ